LELSEAKRFPASNPIRSIHMDKERIAGSAKQADGAI
jgi:hypothetical protein